MSFGFYAYPWNLHDPRSDMAQMQDAGMGHVAVAASYHAGKFLQPRDPRARVYFPEDGTIYFQPSARYGKLKPKVSRETLERDTLAGLCGDGALPVRAWTVLNHNSRLGWDHPEVTAQNAFGDRYPYSLCPAQPDVIEYAITLCRDLAANYDLQQLLLETPGWLTYAHGYHHEFAQAPAHPWLDAMLGLCFCPACRQGAAEVGINVARLAQRVRSRIDGHLSGEAPRDLDRDRAEDDDLGAFIQWRCDVVTGLCRDIVHAVRPGVAVRVISTCQRPHATAWLEGGDLAALNAACDGLELPIYQPSVAEARDDLDHVISCVGDATSLSVILRPGFPDMASEAQVAETVAMVLERGIGDISFYNYGLLPSADIDRLRRCLKSHAPGHAYV